MERKNEQDRENEKRKKDDENMASFGGRGYHYPVAGCADFGEGAVKGFPKTNRCRYPVRGGV